METHPARGRTAPTGKTEAKIVAVTACPTGVALTYMAANRLANTGRRLGYNIKIETQGALGTENTLTRSEIARSSVAIFAADIEISGQDRFIGTPVLRVSTAEAIDDPANVLQRALALVGGGT